MRKPYCGLSLYLFLLDLNSITALRQLYFNHASALLQPHFRPYFCSAYFSLTSALILRTMLQPHVGPTSTLLQPHSPTPTLSIPRTHYKPTAPMLSPHSS